MTRPNVFKYATRELSQDAMVCWLLSCMNSTDPKYRNIGLNFIRLIFNDNTIQDHEIVLESDSPYKQYYHMDVYAIICFRNKMYPIIFENKTNTYLHSNQFQNYCIKVAGWMDDKYLSNLSKNTNKIKSDWGGIVYIFFKTGYMFGWQREDFNKQKELVYNDLKQRNISLCVRELYLEDIVEFLDCQEKDELLYDYYCYLNDQKNKRNFVVSNGMDCVESCYNSLDDNIGSFETESALLFQKIFGDTSYFHYDHQHWASKDLFTITDEYGNKTYYCYRFQWCKFESKRWAPAFQLQQYRDEKDINGSKDNALKSKTEEAERIQNICRIVFDRIDYSNICYRFEQLSGFPCKPYNGQMIMKLFIVDDSTPMIVCDFISSFTKELLNAAISIDNVELECTL